MPRGGEGQHRAKEVTETCAVKTDRTDLTSLLLILFCLFPRPGFLYLRSFSSILPTSSPLSSSLFLLLLGEATLD